MMHLIEIRVPICKAIIAPMFREYEHVSAVLFYITVSFMRYRRGRYMLPNRRELRRIPYPITALLMMRHWHRLC
jgi:hypothetical protein